MVMVGRFPAELIRLKLSLLRVQRSNLVPAGFYYLREIASLHSQ